MSDERQASQPAAPSLPSQDRAMRTGRANLLRRILTNYFSEHVPNGVHRVEDLVARVVGGPPTSVGGGPMVGGTLWTEQELFQKLEAKYGVKVELDPHERA